MVKMSEEQKKKKFKLLMVCPVIVIPFMTLIFWALGGGVRQAASPAEASAKAGINTELPGAKNKDDEGMDKMGFYELAEQDSIKRKEAIRNDPYYHEEEIVDSTASGLIVEENEQEKKVYAKLKQIDAELKNNEKSYSSPSQTKTSFLTTIPNNSTDVDRLEELLKSSQEKNTETDPETEQLNGMLEKILDIQHPDRVREKLKQQSEDNRAQAVPVFVENESSDIHAMEYGVLPADDGEMHNVIPCEIAESGDKLPGATVKIRLLSDVYIMGNLIPRNTFVAGTVSIGDARLQIEVSGIYYNNNIFPVSLSVYDLKGLKGLELHSSVQHEIARQSADRGVQGMNIGSLDPSLGAQAATAGIEMAKNIVSKKFRQIKVPVRSGERILLVSENAMGR